MPMASSNPDPGVLVVNSAFQTTQAQFEPIASEISGCLSRGVPAPPAVLQKAVAYLSALEALFAAAGPIAAHLQRSGELSAEAANQLAVCAKDCQGGRTTYEQMITDDRRWQATRVDYLAKVRDEVTQGVLDTLQKQQARFAAATQQWSKQ